MSKFKFEWKIGDRYNCKPGDQSLSRKYTLQFMLAEEELRLIKPAGKKTKARYKAEKLAWKQSRIAVGDWVERIVEHVAVAAGNGRGENLMKGAVFQITGVFEHSSSAFVSCNTCRHPRADLKPYKPLKPKTITVGQFEIDGNSLIALKYMDCWGRVAIHDGKAEVVFNADGGRPVLHQDDLRSIATLLDLYQASIDAGQA